MIVRWLVVCVGDGLRCDPSKINIPIIAAFSVFRFLRELIHPVMRIQKYEDNIYIIIYIVNNTLNFQKN